MLFTRKHSYQSPHPKSTLKQRLVGEHVTIHDLDFEVMELEDAISIVPHAEQIVEIKTLPETMIDLVEREGSTRVVITSKMRRIDQGGPMLLLILCAMLITVSGIVYFAFESKNHIASYVIFGSCIAIFTIFWVRLQMGYFDYVRKIKAHVLSKEN
ncbi:MAG: hypothetical protein H7257_04855 [Taibaiella sp.]|nr:hypothetical protein [Taibaiella sp.]